MHFEYIFSVIVDVVKIMNLNNIYLLDHQQISAAGYRSNTTNSNSINQPIPQMKSSSLQSNPATSLSHGDNDKVIFKIESDHLTSSPSLPNFKLNYTFSNHQIVNQNNNINNYNNNSMDLKQFKIINNVNVTPYSTQLNNTITSANVLPVKQQQNVIKSEPKEETLPTKVESTVVESQLDSLDPNAINIYVNNVVCSYSTRCHLNLRRIAMEGMHVEYKKENGVSFFTSNILETDT